MKLYASGEDYLEAILVLHKKMGMVRSVDVARQLGVSKPSVCHAVAVLQEGGLLIMDENHFLHLTERLLKLVLTMNCWLKAENMLLCGTQSKKYRLDRS